MAAELTMRGTSLQFLVRRVSTGLARYMPADCMADGNQTLACAALLTAEERNGQSTERSWPLCQRQGALSG